MLANDMQLPKEQLRPGFKKAHGTIHAKLQQTSPKIRTATENKYVTAEIKKYSITSTTQVRRTKNENNKQLIKRQ